MLSGLKNPAVGANVSFTASADDLVGTYPEAAYEHPVCKLSEAFRQEEVPTVAEDVPYLTTPSSVLTREGEGMAIDAILGEKEAVHTFSEGARAGPDSRNMKATGRRYR